MRVRLTPLISILVAGIAGLVSLSLSRGQDPTRSSAPVVTPPGPRRFVPPVTPAARPERKPARDLARLTPLQQQMYTSARRGASWLARMNGVKGRFVPGWIPSLNTAVEGDDFLRQAGAAYALARASRFLQDEDQAARATHAVLTLLQETTESADRKVRHPVMPGAVVNRVAATSLLVLAINELPSPRKELLDQSEQLCEYLRRQQRPDGSLALDQYAGAGKKAADSDAQCQYTGQPLYTLMRSQEFRPAAWKTDVVRKALSHSMKWWREHKDRDSVYWLSAACAEAFLLTKEKAFADAVFEMNDWLCGLQLERLDERHPQWLGGFQNTVAGGAPDIGSAICAGALAEACRVTRQLGDLTRHERYGAALERGLQFVCTLQYTEGETQHFADWYRPRLVGGFHTTHRDGTIRLDSTQHAVSALVQYLRFVAEIR